jgi:CarboxypepD_reg-like domain/Carboxypeptidase regulatory-like domain/TonB-dependent Receptor Plug Domain
MRIAPFLAATFAAAVLQTPLFSATGVAAQSTIGGRLTGTVTDSTLGTPLADARIVIPGTPLFAITNSEGRFFIPDIPAGSYSITFTHPRLDSLGVTPGAVSIRLEPGEGADIRLYVPVAPGARPAAPPPAQTRRAVTPPPPPRPSAREGPTAFVGSIVDASTGRPIAGALLQVRGTSVRNVSDDRGRFVLWGVTPGEHTLDVEMLGYAKRAEPVTAIAGKTLELSVGLSTQPIELDPISVVVRSDWLEMNGFYERREEGLQGTFVDRTAIENRSMATARDLFTAVASLRVDFLDPGHTRVVMRRTPGSGTGEGCAPLFYVDGHRMSGGLDSLEPNTVEAMEVYAGALAPAGYGNSCGAILIWTRRGS